MIFRSAFKSSETLALFSSMEHAVRENAMAKKVASRVMELRLNIDGVMLDPVARSAIVLWFALVRSRGA